MKRRPAMPKQDGSGWKLSKIPVMEIFGPTIQGEGMVIGQKTMFVRTAGCDYSCSWCDSAFTWDGTGKERNQADDSRRNLGGAETTRRRWFFICHDFRWKSGLTEKLG